MEMSLFSSLKSVKFSKFLPISISYHSLNSRILPPPWKKKKSSPKLKISFAQFVP